MPENLSMTCKQSRAIQYTEELECLIKYNVNQLQLDYSILPKTGTIESNIRVKCGTETDFSIYLTASDPMNSGVQITQAQSMADVKEYDAPSRIQF